MSRNIFGAAPTEELTKGMSADEIKVRIQDRLARAKALLDEAAKIADERDVEIDFMELIYRPTFGWERNGELVEASEWNFSECVIGMPEDDSVETAERITLQYMKADPDDPRGR